MIITYIKDQELLKIDGAEITALGLSPNSYTSISFVGSVNCKDAGLKIVTITDLTSTSSLFYLLGSSLYVHPTAFDSTLFEDGIYKIVLKLSKETGYTLIENCIFVDVTYKCKVAAYLENLIEENKNFDKSDKVGTIVHLLHYGLMNGSNCGCNCAEMCQAFAELKTLLEYNKPLNTDCGC